MSEPIEPQPSAAPLQPRQRPGRGIGALIAGGTYPIRAIATLHRYPQLRPYVVYPILLNILLFMTLYTTLVYGGLQVIDAIINDIPNWTAHTPHWAVHLPDWQLSWPTWLPHLPRISLPSVTWPHWNVDLPNWVVSIFAWRPTLPGWVAELPEWGARVLLWLLRLILILILFLVTGFVFLQFGVLLGSPWYGKLSEELEQLRTGKLVSVDVGVVGDVGRAIAYELKKLGISLSLGIPLLLIGFIPGIGTMVGLIGGTAIAATIVCLDFLDGPLERRRLRFRDKLKVVANSLPASASFALVCLGLVSIPFINLLAIPVGVTAGTLFVCDRVLPFREDTP